MRIARGSYTGTAADGKAITGVGFRPDVVFIKSNSAVNMVYKTKTMGFDQTKDMVGATALEPNLIISLDPDGFTLGTDSRVNAAVTNYWLALQEGANDLKCFSYIGNGVDNRALSGVGFTPDMVLLASAGAFTVKATTTDLLAAGSFSTPFVDNGGFELDMIQAFEADGLQIGANAAVNTAGTTYHGIAIKSASSLCKIISYAGTGVDGLTVTGAGFTPQAVIVLPPDGGSFPAAFRGNHSGDSSALVNAANAADIIQSYTADGFTVGTNASVNTNGANYYAIAFKAGTSSSSLTVALSNRDITVNLDDHTYHGINFGGGFGDPEINRQWSPVWGRGHHPLGGVSYGNRQIELPIRITAAALDNWAQRSRNIHLILRDAERYAASQGREGLPATLWVQLNGMTNEIIYDVLAGDLKDSALVNPAMAVTTAPRVMNVALQLTVKPFGRPQNPVSEVSASLTNGTGTFTLATLARGDVPAPQRLTVKPAQAMGRLIIGRKSRGNLANTTFALECEPGTFTGYTVSSSAASTTGGTTVTEASAHGGVVFEPNTSVIKSWGLTWTLTSNVIDWFGRYRVFLNRARGATAVSGETAQLSYGGASGDDVAVPSVTLAVGSTGFGTTAQVYSQLTDLGILNIPHRFGPNDLPPSQYKFRIVGTVTATGNQKPAWDNIFLIPLDEFYADITVPGTMTSVQSLILDQLADVPSVYVKSASGLEGLKVDYNQFSGAIVEPRKSNRWDVLIGRTTALGNSSVFLTDAFTLQSDYNPLYNRFYATNAS